MSKQVTVKELIEFLSTIEDKNTPVEIAVSGYTHKGAAFYAPVEKDLWGNAAVNGPFGTVRLFASLPSDEKTYTTISRRNK